ncbi:hypothetical protein AG4045_018510 [Apium graveolens]|uniref:Legume lectin domain-containing protein n=1 Tax=Apium graveolens TaxID=4045 RepID=A0A6L5BCR1_APIGR|nr:hypothetical protein AG4045_018510 [Apium graveolens]
MAYTTCFISVAILFLFLQTCWCDTNDGFNLAPLFSPIFDQNSFDGDYLGALGTDCSNLGISILKPPASSPPPTLSDKSSNQGAVYHNCNVFLVLLSLFTLHLSINNKQNYVISI